MNAPPKPDNKTTPMMAQFMEIKAANMDCILFYRMGDFYELFLEDAQIASRALGITLTTRGKHMGEPIPMCGVPVRAADEYLQKLIKAGFRIAVCEQMEDPKEAKKRGHKAVVRRDVVRLVTPGTITEENLLDTRTNNYLTALFEGKVGDEVALASLDISTGDFEVCAFKATDLAGELTRLSPREILVSDQRQETGEGGGLKGLVEQIGATLSPQPAIAFNARTGEGDLKKHLKVDALDGFGAFSKLELAAVAALLRYVELTQIDHFPVLRAPKRRSQNGIMVIDAATRVNLELLISLKGERNHSLLGAIDRTLTGAGTRELASRLSAPLMDSAHIDRRLDGVSFLLEDLRLRDDVRDLLKSTPDMARAIARLSVARGGPRDLEVVCKGLLQAGNIATRLSLGLGLPSVLADIVARLRKLDEALLDELSRALVEDLPVLAREGGFIAKGYRPELDELRLMRDESRQIIAGLQAGYCDDTGIKNLKIKHNNVLGYFIEVTAINGERLMQPPLSDKYVHRQTLANAVRFVTVELSEAEQKITTAKERALAIELELFAALVQQVLACQQEIGVAAQALAKLDVYGALAQLAQEHNHTRPRIDDSLAFAIEGGRHPVVEQALRKDNEGPFIENDCVLEESGVLEGGDGENKRGRLWVLTGPNMAGKSTFLRQNALVAVMAQAGCFVPAQKAHIGLVDRLFSRVGASDDLARGRSTFMVEMVETAGILNQAGERSLVILDEIGRGTATFDGLSIAWATIEHLHEVNKSRALFATHYHELTALTQKLERATNVTIEVKEWRDEIIFLHKVSYGMANRSYGIQVARLAGLPGSVITRASEVLALLEQADDRKKPAELVEELPLFAASRPQSVRQQEPGKLQTALDELDLDDLTPREALEALYQLRDLAEKK
ncbi:MAG: DNA mismatch repair protein MutS [Hyphomicrobiaceae bacterium]|nr:DNA mismatch repair protein MutS [Hyphomicrobiaceae bacterium]